MSDARRYAVWPDPRSRSLKESRPSVPHGTNFSFLFQVMRSTTLALLPFVEHMLIYFHHITSQLAAKDVLVSVAGMPSFMI